ncbi:MAG TPA: hypothetical protein VKW76_06570 [Candidatus Binatia bacterium]|nr:hypothetical protein [Candidatus Binatia bacterium]
MIAAIAIGFGRAVRGVWWFRGTHVVRCPEVGRPAGAALDLGHLALTALRGAPSFRIGACSRWPARRDCAQQCVAQIVQGPRETHPRMLLVRWYAGKACALCADRFGPLHRTRERPAVMWPDGRTARWSEIRVEELPQVLATCQPICRRCHITQVFRRLYPGVDGPWTREAARAAARRAAAASRA